MEAAFQNVGAAGGLVCGGIGAPGISSLNPKQVGILQRVGKLWLPDFGTAWIVGGLDISA